MQQQHFNIKNYKWLSFSNVREKVYLYTSAQSIRLQSSTFFQLPTECHTGHGCDSYSATKLVWSKQSRELHTKLAKLVH